jgi:hypothetical protein
LTNDERRDLEGDGAERESDAELGRAARGGHQRHADDADHREQQRQGWSADAARVYRDNPTTLDRRAMNMLYEG